LTVQQDGHEDDETTLQRSSRFSALMVVTVVWRFADVGASCRFASHIDSRAQANIVNLPRPSPFHHHHREPSVWAFSNLHLDTQPLLLISRTLRCWRWWPRTTPWLISHLNASTLAPCFSSLPWVGRFSKDRYLWLEIMCWWCARFDFGRSSLTFCRLDSKWYQAGAIPSCVVVAGSQQHKRQPFVSSTPFWCTYRVRYRLVLSHQM